MRVGSLFSGIGGIELGFERAGGFKTEWFVENDKYARKILRKHWPRAIIYDDITQVDFATVPEIDILAGGFPCQDISNAGRRAGITGSRSSLWSYFAQAISVLRPRYVLIENVSALTHRGLDTVLCDLATLRYDAEWHCVPASSIGAPHRRDRIFILAYSYNTGQQNRVRKQRREQTQARKRKYSFSRCSIRFNTNVSNPNSKRQQLCRTKTRPRKRIITRYSSQSRTFGTKSQFSWSTEPRICRVVNGVSNRIHRIKCLGNAVVPQVAEVFARAIKKRETKL